MEPRQQQNMRMLRETEQGLREEKSYASGPKGFATDVARWNKALKIISILKECRGEQGRPSLLDIGTGNGEIAGCLGQLYDVVSVDVKDQRTVSDGFTFIQLDGEALPFSDRSFDIVVSNHVIEHVADAIRHLSEIERVLKDDGLAYLATPNRLWPWEVHNRLPLLHYFPTVIFNAVLKLLGRYQEDISPLTWWTLSRMLKKAFVVSVVSDRICKRPLKYHMQCNPLTAKILSWIPLWFYRKCTFIHPTLVVVLRK